MSDGQLFDERVADDETTAKRYKVTECRSCHAPVVWGQTTSGTRLMLDSTDTGELVIVDRSVLILDSTSSGSAWPVVRHLRGERLNGPRAHFATCPHAEEWRRNPPKPPSKGH